MAKLIDLVEGFPGVDASELEKHIKDRATELKLKVFLDDGDKNIFVPKARLDAEVVKNVELKKTISEQKASIDKLGELTKENEDAQATIQKLTDKVSTIEQTMKDNALTLALKAKALELGAIDESGQDLLAFLDKGKLIVNDDGSVTGLDEALKSLKASKQYLFKQEDPGNNNNNNNPGTGAPGRPASGSIPGSVGVKPGDFGASLSTSFGANMGYNPQANGQSPQVIDFFK